MLKLSIVYYKLCITEWIKNIPKRRNRIIMSELNRVTDVVYWNRCLCSIYNNGTTCIVSHNKSIDIDILSRKEMNQIVNNSLKISKIHFKAGEFKLMLLWMLTHACNKPDQDTITKAISKTKNIESVRLCVKLSLALFDKYNLICLIVNNERVMIQDVIDEYIFTGFYFKYCDDFYATR